MSNSTAEVLAAEDGPWAQIRSGVVVAQDASAVTVLVGGTQIRAAYELGAIFNDGDLVYLWRQDASWGVLYKPAGAGPNEVQNPSFELDNTGTPPSMWLLADLVGLSQASVASMPGVPDGEKYALIVSDAAVSSSYLYSSPIAATAGEVFSLSAYVTGIYAVDAPQTADAALMALWFANTTDVYPTTSSADIIVDTFTDVPSGPPFVQLSGTVPAPVTGFLRVALRSNMTVGQSLGWDLVIGRRLS